MVTIAKHRARRHDGKLKPLAKFVNTVLDVTVGFGYRPWRIGLLACAIVVVGGFVFAWAQPVNIKDPSKVADPFLYSLDAFLPAVNLRHEEVFVATGRGVPTSRTCCLDG